MNPFQSTTFVRSFGQFMILVGFVVMCLGLRRHVSRSSLDAPCAGKT